MKMRSGFISLALPHALFAVFGGGGFVTVLFQRFLHDEYLGG